MTKLGMGVVGVGTMGKRHAENIRRLIPEAQLIAVADADPERARQVAAELEIEYSYSSVEALVEQKDIQAVAIVTPAKFHGAAIKTCAHAGKDIFCEKPLTLTVEEADEVLSVTSKAGVRLQPGHVRMISLVFGLMPHALDPEQLKLASKDVAVRRKWLVHAPLRAPPDDARELAGLMEMLRTACAIDAVLWIDA